MTEINVQKNQTQRRILGAAFLILTTLIAPELSQADWTQIPPSQFTLPPPPAPGTPVYTEDFRKLHELQDQRSAQQCQLGRQQEIPSFDTFFGKNAALLSSAEISALRPLFNKIFSLADDVTAPLKSKYSRPRPYSTDPTIHPCITPPGGSKSYPSGHATMASLGSCILSQAFPDRARRILVYGGFIADLRVIVGVHHPSDVEAGKSLGQAICQELLRAPDFRQDLQRAVSGRR